MKRIKWFNTERQARNYLKKNRKKIKFPGFKPSVQGNAIVFIARRKRR